MDKQKNQFENSQKTLNDKIDILEEELAMTQGQRNGYQEELQILNQAVQESEKKLSECRAQIAQFSTDNVKNNKQMENDAIAIQRLEEEKNRMREMLVTVEGEKRDSRIKGQGKRVQ